MEGLSPGQRELLEALRDAIVEIDEAKAGAIAEEVVQQNIDPRLAIKSAIAEAALRVGERFDRGEYYLPHLVMSGDVMDAVAKILQKNIPAEQVERKKVIVIGAVQGDMHSVGKNIVAIMLRSAGFAVHDLGVDVSSRVFIERASELGADMIALSSLLTTTMPFQKDVIDDLVSMGLRGRFRVMVGGGPVTREYALKIAADGYGKDAIEAVVEANRLIG